MTDSTDAAGPGASTLTSTRTVASDGRAGNERISLIRPAMASRRSFGVGLLACLAACSRPTGDFGRVEPSVLHDQILPGLGNRIASSKRDELVSDFNQTDNEKTLRDLAWQLVQPPHLKDWFGATLVEFQRTRVLPEMDQKWNTKAYYELLRRDDFISSETRWQRLISDMHTDEQLVGPFWKHARKVKADDVARAHTMDGRPDLTSGELYAATARIEENARVVDWVWRSMRFRLKSYRLCIERMLVETPTSRQWEVNQAWDSLQTAIALAEQDTSSLRFPNAQSVKDRPSRYKSADEIHDVVPQK